MSELPQGHDILLPDSTRAVLEEWLATRQEIINAADRGALSTYRPQAYQLPFHQSSATNRWFLGANRTGKTLVCYNELRWFALGTHPYRRVKPAKLIWICCPTEELARLIHFPAIEALFGSENIEKKTLGAHITIKLKNGCMIVFKYYAQGKKVFPSAGVDLVFCDEEPPYEIFQEIWSRRSTRTLNIIGANTMVNGFTWMYEKVVQNQLPNTEFWVAKLDDNQFIPATERELMKAGLKNDPTMYAIRVEGKTMPVGGGMRFDKGAMSYYIDNVKEPKARFSLDIMEGRWVQNPYGELSIWNMPEDEQEYCIGLDVAEGLNISYSDQEPIWDSTSAQIFNRHTKKFVAEWTAGNVEPGHVGQHVLPRLSEMFNKAYCNVELNLHGFTVVSHAKDKISSRLWSPITDEAAWKEKPLRKYGTLLSSNSRRYLIDTMAQIVLERRIIIPSGHLVQEMLNLVRKEGGKVEHRDGFHDDRVFAAGHALVMDAKLPAPRRIGATGVKKELREWALKNGGNGGRPNYFRVIA